MVQTRDRSEQGHCQGVTMWLTVNGLRSRALEGPHVNPPVAGFRTQVAELTAVSPLPPELEAPVKIIQKHKELIHHQTIKLLTDIRRLSRKLKEY